MRVCGRALGIPETRTGAVSYELRSCELGAVSWELGAGSYVSTIKPLMCYDAGKKATSHGPLSQAPSACALQAPRAVGRAGGLQQRIGSDCVGHIAAGAGGRRGAARGRVLHAV
jgi:hypothetical protein